jgi:hypothetical protein
LRIFCVGVLGKSSTHSTYLGTMKRGTRAARNDTSAASEIVAPGLHTATIFTSSSPTPDGTPMAAAPMIPSMAWTSVSSSIDEMFSPRLRMVSLSRSTK